jgi:hypothetical protein
MNFLSLLAKNIRPGGGGDPGIAEIAPIQQGPGVFGGLGNPMGGGGMQQEMPGATREQEAMAKQNGFRSYEEMLLWAQQRNRRSGGTIDGGGSPPPPSKKKPQQNPASGGISGIFDRITNAMRGSRQ